MCIATATNKAVNVTRLKQISIRDCLALKSCAAQGLISIFHQKDSDSAVLTRKVVGLQAPDPLSVFVRIVSQLSRNKHFIIQRDVSFFCAIQGNYFNISNSNCETDPT